MCAFKGRFIYRQFIPSKRTRFGIKLWVLCDSQTGYILKVSVYTGSYTDYPVLDKTELVSTRVVKHLMDGYRDRGNVVFTDNFYTSPGLANDLRKLGLGMCGTVITSRSGMPNIFG